MQEVWGERSCCQCFSPSPLTGVKGTALDAICSAEGRSVCQDLGAAARLCTEFGPKWQGQLSDGTEGHGQAMLGSFGQVLLSCTRV